MPLDPTTLKIGDRFYESEYGTTIEAQVITTPAVNGDLLEFKAKTIKTGRIIDYAFNVKNSAYNPTIYSFNVVTPRQYRKRNLEDSEEIY